MKKNIFLSLFSGIAAMLCFVFFANAQGVALPTNVGLPSGSLTGVVSNFTNWILGIFGFLAIISFLVSGLMYFLAAGDDKAQEKAKKQMTWSIMGVVIGLVGLVVIYAVDMLLNGGGGSGFFGMGSAPTSQSSSWSSTTNTIPAPTTNTTEWLGTGTSTTTGNRIFIDQQQNSFELVNGKLVPLNGAGANTNSGPDSSYQP